MLPSWFGHKVTAKTFERKGLRVGTVAETVTVTADAPLIETSNASHAEVIDSKTIEQLLIAELPLRGEVERRARPGGG